MTEVEIPAAGSFRFDGRVALITGAGRNVGAAIARELHLGGANVAVTDANAGWAEETARALDPTGETVMAIELDVREVGHFEAARDAVIAKWGKLDIVVNNAQESVASLPRSPRPAGWPRSRARRGGSPHPVRGLPWSVRP